MFHQGVKISSLYQSKTHVNEFIDFFIKWKEENT